MISNVTTANASASVRINVAVSLAENSTKIKPKTSFGDDFSFIAEAHD